MLETQVTNFGTAGESMIFQMGRENGELFCRDIIDEIGNEDESLDNIFNSVLKKASEAGWG